MNRLLPAGVALCVLWTGVLYAADSTEKAEMNEQDRRQFEQLRKQNWQETFHDTCTEDWTKLWTLDGLKARISHSDKGMDFHAGPNRNDASHAVLWTRQSFSGDLRIEFDYTRLDEATKYVNIIYLHATGSGEEPYVKDIAQWARLRKVPRMSLYFDHMNAYHVSYAAFDNRNNDPTKDYIRARRYVAGEGLDGTDLSPDYFRTGMFATGVPHHLTLIKQGDDLFFEVRNAEKVLLCHWKTNTVPPLNEGRIGLRQMNTRAGRYRDFRVYILPPTGATAPGNAP
ncbi:MAG TPA: hypothetical protein DCX07_03560 [Phycisphaerales bacterium]|nr:hypothetical protein [Phycisphaerales bacterium]